MPSLIISVQEDGIILVAGVEPTPEMLQGAESFGSIAEATQAITESLEPAGEEAAEPSQNPNSPGEMAESGGAPAPQGGDGMDALVEGFNRAKKGR